MNRRGAIIRIVWATCLLLAGMNHARILLHHGLWWDYGDAHPASAVYWSSLTLVDPLVAVLLFVRPRIGVPATVALIATNVIHNLAVTLYRAPDSTFPWYVLSSWQMASQIGFLLFAVATWRMAWPERKGPPQEKRSRDGP